MNAACITVLVDKVDEALQKDALKAIRTAVAGIVALEDDFPRRMAENKRKRGQVPVQLSEDEEAVINDSADAALEVESFDLRICMDAATPADALAELLPFQQEDVDMWAFLASGAQHDDDRAAVEEVRLAKVALVAQMREFIQENAG